VQLWISNEKWVGKQRTKLDSNKLMEKRLNTLSLATSYCLGWFPVAIFAMYMKYYEIASRYSQLLFVNSNIADPTISDYLFLYKSDILINFLVIPLLIIAITYFFYHKRNILLFFTISLSLIILVLLYANLHSWGTIGRFLTWTAAVDAITFGWQNISFIEMYIDFDSWVKFSILVMAVLVLFLGSRHFSRSKLLIRSINVFVGVVFLVAIIAVLVGQTSAMKDAPTNRDFISQAMAALFKKPWDAGHFNQDIRNKGLLESFRAITQTRSHDDKSEYYGLAKDNDVIVFVLETGSDRFMNLRDDLDSFPTLGKLSSNSLIAMNHHTTFPATSEALFSLFNSIYPPRNYYSTCIVSHSVKSEQAFPGFVSLLQESGYETSLYLPYNDVVPLDHALHQNLGFNKIYFAQAEKNEGKGMDRQALEAMKRDISGWMASDQRYVSVLLTQIGHAPWPSRPESRSITEHGKLVAKIQEEWLGELVELIDRAGKLEKTTIIIAGDHGIRTAREDPELNTGFIDEYSFRVPLLIFSKSAFSQPTYTNMLTSHIDISPTLLDLLGVNRNKTLEQGLGLWDSGLKDRTTFFLGNWYFGADSFHENGEFKMYSEVLAASFTNNKLQFDASNLVEDEGEVLKIRDKTRKLYALQNEWLKQNFCD
jgi:membrane-anchored protein YejM (alkaline phosphatase superfamily)